MRRTGCSRRSSVSSIRRVPRALRRAAEREFLSVPGRGARPIRAAALRRGAGPPRRLLLLHRLEPACIASSTRSISVARWGRSRSGCPAGCARRLGELAVDLRTGRPIEITMSRRHIARHSWAEVEHTLLHEMVHQWQAETGLRVDHGPTFRRKAREVGVLPRAKREVGPTVAPSIKVHTAGAR